MSKVLLKSDGTAALDAHGRLRLGDSSDPCYCGTPCTISFIVSRPYAGQQIGNATVAGAVATAYAGSYIDDGYDIAYLDQIWATANGSVTVTWDTRAFGTTTGLGYRLTPWVNGVQVTFDGPVTYLDGLNSPASGTLTLVSGDRLQLELSDSTERWGWLDVVPDHAYRTFRVDSISACDTHAHQRTLVPLLSCPSGAVTTIYVGGDPRTCDSFKDFYFATIADSETWPDGYLLRRISTGLCYIYSGSTAVYLEGAVTETDWSEFEAITTADCAECSTADPPDDPPDTPDRPLYVPGRYCSGPQAGQLIGRTKPVSEIVANSAYWKLTDQICASFDVTEATETAGTIAVGGVSYASCAACAAGDDVPPWGPWPPGEDDPFPPNPPAGDPPVGDPPPRSVCNVLYTCDGNHPTDQYVDTALGLAGKVVKLAGDPTRTCYRVEVMFRSEVPTIWDLDQVEVFNTCSGCRNYETYLPVLNCDGDTAHSPAAYVPRLLWIAQTGADIMEETGTGDCWYADDENPLTTNTTPNLLDIAEWHADCDTCGTAPPDAPCTPPSGSDHDLILDQAASITPAAGFEQGVGTIAWDGSLIWNGTSWSASIATFEYASDGTDMEGGVELEYSLDADGLGNCGLELTITSTRTSDLTPQTSFHAYSVYGADPENSHDWVITIGSGVADLSFTAA